MNEQSPPVRPASQTTECSRLVDASCSVVVVDFIDRDVQAVSSTDSDAETSYCQTKVYPKTDESRASAASSGLQQAYSDDGYRTAAPASQPDSVATGQSGFDSSSPYQSNVADSYSYQRAAGVIAICTSQLGPPQPLACISADDSQQC